MQTTKKKPAYKPPAKKPDLKIESIQVRHDYTDSEMADHGRSSQKAQVEIHQLESELSSIKKDYAGKIELATLKRDCAFGKLRDGYEMRPCEAVVQFNTPKKGRKSYWAHDPKKKEGKGTFLKEEDMSPSDAQMEWLDKTPAAVPAKQAELPNPVLPAEVKSEFSEDDAAKVESLVEKATGFVRLEGVPASIDFLKKKLRINQQIAAALMHVLKTRGVVGEEGEDGTHELLPITCEPSTEKTTA